MTRHAGQYPPDVAELRRARVETSERAAQLGAVPEVCDAVALIVDELFNNAIEHGHGYRRSRAALVFAMALHGDRIHLEFEDPEMPEEQVRDLAQALGEAANGMPALDSERGRGLFLISIYMEELRVAVAPGGGLQLQGRLAKP